MFKQFKVTKRSSTIIISVSLVCLCVIGVTIYQSIFSSRVVLKDELKIHRKLLHNAEQEHDCHCYSPFITDFNISNITSNSADFSWECDAPSSYQVKYGESIKDKYFPKTTPNDSYRKYTVKLKGLKPKTDYRVGPSSICKKECTRNEYIGKRRTSDANGTSEWKFTTLDEMTYSISGGAIRSATDSGISGVTVTLSGDKDDEMTTQSDGAYEFADLSPGEYTITPTKDNFEFEPAFKTYSSLNGNQTNENFEGTPATNIVVKQYLISVAKVAEVTAKDVTIRWKTNIPATSLVEYGLTNKYGLKTEMNMTQSINHVIQVFDFKLGTTYNARAVSTDPATGKAIYSANFTFKTPSKETRIIDPMAVFNEPNPAFTRTSFVYQLFQPAQRMTIDILTISGKTVATLEAPQSTLKGGYNKVMWDLRDNNDQRVSNGVYLYKMKFYLADNQVKEVKKSNLIVRR